MYELGGGRRLLGTSNLKANRRPRCLHRRMLPKSTLTSGMVPPRVQWLLIGHGWVGQQIVG